MNSTDFFKRIASHWNKQLPLVVFKNPNASEINAFLQSDSILKTADSSVCSGFVMGNFDPNETPYLIADDEVLQTTHAAQAFSISQPQNAAVPVDSNEYERYTQLLSACIEEIQQTDLQKVVLSRPLQVPLKQQDPFELFQKALEMYPTAFCYLWYHPHKGLWIGATPETLFHLEEQQLTTMALAGTTTAKNSASVVWGQKEIHEQELVTQSIEKALKSLPGNQDIVSCEPKTLQAGKLFHLKTAITATVTQASVWDLIAALHPTPAVGGVPRKKAFDFIQKNEGYSRSFYSGFLGPISQNRSSLFVNLRCMQWELHRATLYVGSGITAASQPHLEWEETQQKAQTMLCLIQSTY